MPIDHIGRYKIDAELGKGAMGVVYKATDPNIGRTVALKTMRVDTGGMESEEMIKRFHAEARNAGVLNHPNIVTIYDAQELEGTFYIAMEFIQGQTLQELLKLKSIPVEQVVDVIRQVCAGLDYAHAKGIIHRDIKPANIMIQPDGTVKIMDFGIAKGAGTGMTSTGQVLGTPNYMSPEQVKGKPLDGRTDLFSLGVVLYEMLTGERPFTGENVTTIIYKIVNEQPPAPRDLDITVHPGLSAAVMKALAKNRDERHQKCAELARELENYKNFGNDTGQTTKILTDTAAVAAMQPPVRATSGTVAVATGAAGAAAKLAPKSAPKLESTVQVAKKAVAKLSHPLPVKQRPVGLIVAALVVVLAIGGYFGLKRKSQPQQSTVQPTTSNAATAQPKAPEQTPPAEAAQPPATEAAKSEAPAPTTGDLRIVSTPAGAKFTVDGRAEARYVTPFTVTKLKEGPHTIVFSMDGYRTDTRHPEVVLGKRTSVNAMLFATVGFLTVNSNPAGGTITIDGKPTGAVTPAKINVEPGQHKISVHKPGYKELAMNAALTAGQTLAMEFPLAAQATPAPLTPQAPATSAPKQASTSQNVPPSNAAAAKQEQEPTEEGNPFRRGLRKLFGGSDRGSLILRTKPMAAEIWVNGKQTQYKTPMKFPAPVGKYKVSLRLQGYKPLNREVEIEKGKTVTIEENLEKQ